MSEVITTIEIQEIMELLPHRYPFLLVDRVIEYEADSRIVGIKNVTINEPFFQGHFPGIPIMPGVLIIEAMAQVGGVLVFKTLPDREKKLVFFAAIKNARFRKPVVPGDQLRIEMLLTHVRRSLGKLKGEAYVDTQLVAEAEIMFSLVDRHDFISSSGE
jgi:beta-hydroxyacyl-ACP dehydratase FabZ